jgi:hypothetical protein
MIGGRIAARLRSASPEPLSTADVLSALILLVFSPAERLPDRVRWTRRRLTLRDRDEVEEGALRLAEALIERYDRVVAPLVADYLRRGQSKCPLALRRRFGLVGRRPA